MFSLCLFVCLLAGLHKIIEPIFTKFGGKVAHENLLFTMNGSGIKKKKRSITKL